MFGSKDFVASTSVEQRRNDASVAVLGRKHQGRRHDLAFFYTGGGGGELVKAEVRM